MKSHLLLVILGSLLIIISCKKEDSSLVDQDKIHASYVFEYNANQNVTFARTHFSYGGALGSKFQLSLPAMIDVNGDAMAFNEYLYYYERVYTGYQNHGHFKYIDTEGREYSNTAAMLSSINFDSTLDTISRSTDYLLTWAGNPVQSGEVVTVIIDGNGEDDTQTFTQSSVGATNINLTQDQLGNLGLENATFYINRSKIVNAQEVTSVGGKVLSRYNGQTMTVYVAQ